MPYADLKSLKLHYEEYRPAAEPSKIKAPPVLFLHGFTLDHHMWQPQAVFFQNERRVILVDARGHGLSDAPETGYSRAHRVEDLQRFIDHLQIERFHLVGLSMGGSTGIGYALKHQDRLASLTLVSTGAAGYNVGKKISRIDRIAREKGVEAAQKKWKDIALGWYRQDKKEIRDLMERMINEHSGAVWRDPMRGRYPREYDVEKVHAITVPTMIFAGAADRIFLPLARLLNERIPNSRLRVYDDVGHMVNLEAPERFNRELKQFLEQVESQ
jgi:pimeloyl-ACP methyl ester carboxylesterase